MNVKITILNILKDVKEINKCRDGVMSKNQKN